MVDGKKQLARCLRRGNTSAGATCCRLVQLWQHDVETLSNELQALHELQYMISEWGNVQSTNQWCPTFTTQYNSFNSMAAMRQDLVNESNYIALFLSFPATVWHEAGTCTTAKCCGVICALQPPFQAPSKPSALEVCFLLLCEVVATAAAVLSLSLAIMGEYAMGCNGHEPRNQPNWSQMLYHVALPREELDAGSMANFRHDKTTST